MKRSQVVLASMAILLIAVAVTGSAFIAGRAIAAPSSAVDAKATWQTTGDSLTYVSLSSMAFMPVNSDAFYNKDPERQILTLRNQSRPGGDANIFVAPLTLPDRSRFVGMTVFGEDFDSRGAVRVRLKRCDHGQPRCLNLAEAGSAEPFADGWFDTGRIPITNAGIDNNLYSYFLELELSAIFNSGLRSVRLEIVETNGEIASPEPEQQWTLSGSTTSFPLPNTGWTEVRICTNDLSHLDNPTHYPILMVDGETTVLSSNTCVTAQGFDVEIGRRLNTGPSSGTYQFLR